MKVPHLRETSLPQIIQPIRDLAAGRSNAVGTCTLAANSDVFTVVTAPNCGLDSKIFLFPTTANAAHEMANGSLFVSAVGSGEFTIAHSNDGATADNRSYFWVALG